jgi:hypothetical protein
LKRPDDVRTLLVTRWRRTARDWLSGAGEWPLAIPLGAPGDKAVRTDLAAAREWIASWEKELPAGEVTWVTREWRALGKQQIPERLMLPDADAVARWVGQSSRWQLARERFHILAMRWPALMTVLPASFDLLADYTKEDFQRMTTLLAWLEANPNSGLYPRQLPIAGLDSKWLEQRRPVVTQWLAALRGVVPGDFYATCGLRAPAEMLRMRILDQELRAYVGDMLELIAPAEELAKLQWPVRQAFIVENLQTGMAFTDLPGSIVFMGKGYSVPVLKTIPWLADIPCWYWGDLDTHGFAILNRVRYALSHVESILMDETTLLSHRELWGDEPTPTSAALPLLTQEEQSVYQGLQQHRWGCRVRLEQERLNWAEAWAILQKIAWRNATI